MGEALPSCPRCGGRLPTGSAGQVCPACTARFFLEVGSQVESSIHSQPTEIAGENRTTAAAPNLFAVAGRSPQRLEILGVVGEGGMGRVCEARDQNLGRTVALKRLKAEHRHSPECLARFLAEAQIASQLEHPGIVPVYELGVDAEGQAFYTMRKVQGATLAGVLENLKAQKPEAVAGFPLGVLLGIFQKVCEALAYAHSRNVIHRDLKPENIMIGEFGEALVMDWGLAKVLDQEIEPAAPPANSAGLEPDLSPSGEPSPSEVNGDLEAERAAASVGAVGASPAPVGGPMSGSTALPSPAGLTGQNVVMGSLGYMAPEQAGGHAQIADARADIYALGAILYHILTLRAPVRGKDPRLMLDRTIGGDIRPPAHFNPGGPAEVQRWPLLHCPGQRIPEALSAVAMKALATNPKDRYPTVEALRHDVTQWLNGFPVSVERSGLPRLLAQWARRHRTAVGAGALILLLIAGFSWQNWRSLRRLENTAPAFAALAESLVQAQRFDEALEQIESALRLRPGQGDYLALKGTVLLALLEVEGARAAFGQALESGAAPEPVQEYIRLCDHLLARRAPDGRFSEEALFDLYHAFLLRGRTGEAMLVSTQLLEQRQKLLEFWRKRLERAGIRGTLTLDKDGQFELGIGNHAVTNLSPLAGLPLVNLFIGQAPNLTDLSPLTGMPLRVLVIYESGISDLRPLARMPLRELALPTAPQVADLGPLRGLPLRSLQLHRAAVTDLTPLSGMPLQALDLYDVPIRDISALREAPLQALNLNATRFTNLPQLAGLPLGSLQLNGAAISDISELAHFNLGRLELAGTRVGDLRPIAHMPLDYLDLSETPVSDLGPLRGLKTLTHLYLERCARLRDLSPLRECDALVRLRLPPHPQDIEFLRQFPRLTEINGVPAAEFWKSYDARKGAR